MVSANRGVRKVEADVGRLSQRLDKIVANTGREFASIRLRFEGMFVLQYLPYFKLTLVLA